MPNYFVGFEVDVPLFSGQHLLQPSLQHLLQFLHIPILQHPTDETRLALHARTPAIARAFIPTAHSFFMNICKFLS